MMDILILLKIKRLFYAKTTTCEMGIFPHRTIQCQQHPGTTKADFGQGGGRTLTQNQGY